MRAYLTQDCLFAVYAAQVWAAGLIRAVLRPFSKMRLWLPCFLRSATPGFRSMLSAVLHMSSGAHKMCAAAGCPPFLTYPSHWALRNICNGCWIQSKVRA